MSSEEKPDMARSWQALEKIIAEDDAKRANWLETASDEEIEQRMNADGVKLSGTTTAEDILARMKEREGGGTPGTGKGGGGVASGAKVRRLPFKRKVGPWVVGLAVAGGAGTVIAERAIEMLAAHGRPDTERAAQLREEAFAACDAAQWAMCARKLDDAKGVDPEGEGDPRVVRARAAIAKAGGGGTPDPR